MKLMENIVEFDVRGKDGFVSRRAVHVNKVCMCRACSRDIEATRKRLDKKRAEGYVTHGELNICRRSRYLLTNEDIIEVQGPRVAGEVELVAIVDQNDVLISTGSDNNDMSLQLVMWTESLGKVYDTTKSKQMVPAVVSKDAWLYEDVKDHWNELILRSYVTVQGEKIPYQSFTPSGSVDLEHHFRNSPWLREDGVVLFCGTGDKLPTVPPNVYKEYWPSDFQFEVYDPVLKRAMAHSFTIQSVEELP